MPKEQNPLARSKTSPHFEKMLSASSPVAYPPSSSPPPPKRPSHDASRPPKPRIRGPFVIEDDESEDENGLESVAHIAKKRMIRLPSDGHPDVAELAVSHGDEEHGPASGAEDLAGPQPLQSVWPSSHRIFSGPMLGSVESHAYASRTCAGTPMTIRERRTATHASYESMVAARSKTKEGRAKRSYYGIEIHELMNRAARELAEKRQPNAAGPDNALASVEEPTSVGKKPRKTLLWTEKYRARTFMDLCGDDGTNRMVLRWLKRWDPMVFPGSVPARTKGSRRPTSMSKVDEDKSHRKILLLTGPPGLGKTTLAHVCARQAGYEVLEVNASDDRNRDVVKNRIRTSLGTQSVKTVTNARDDKAPHRPTRPMCVVVDEVDGVTSGAGASGDGGFIKALIDMVLVDQKNAMTASGSAAESSRKKNKGDDFRQMRPLILICNDVYHASLRPLRQSNLAEIIHVGRPSVEAAVGRLKTIFEKEGIPCEKDAARKLCEAAWGIASGVDAKRGAESTVEGDLRGVMVVGEWVAGRFRSSRTAANQMLTRQWIESHVLHDLSSGAAGARGLGRGSAKDIIGRLFQEGGGFPRPPVGLTESQDKAKDKHEQPRAELGFGEQQKKYAMERLAQMINTSGEIGNIVTGIFAEYPDRDFNDDCYLTKPNRAYEWLHFHDECQSRLYASQEWGLAPYLSQPVLACHHLFASPRRHFGGFDKWRGAKADDDGEARLPFSGPRADYEAREAEKHSRAQLQALQAQLSPSLMRVFRSAEDVAAEFLPYLVRMVSPHVQPVVVGGSQGSMASVRKESERALVRRASEVLAEVGIALCKGKIEGDATAGRGPQFVYRMEPDIDALAAFETGASPAVPATRYAVRQVLEQELKRTLALRETMARQARFHGGGGGGPLRPTATGAMATAPSLTALGMSARAREAAAAAGTAPVKRDFFGRVVAQRPVTEAEAGAARKEARKVWVTFHEGLNNAVRKPISVDEFMREL